MINKVFEKNKIGRDFIVGDLHGCITLFNEELMDINFNKVIDRMFSVGDLVDRGTNSLECLRLIKEPWFHAVLGNHEQFLINSVIDSENRSLWIQNGGIWHLGVPNDELKELALLAKELPLAITVGDIGICHAECPVSDWNDIEKIGSYEKEKMIWGRTNIKLNLITKNITNTYHGHTIKECIKVSGNAIFIDTGAYFYNNLTIIEI